MLPSILGRFAGALAIRAFFVEALGAHHCAAVVGIIDPSVAHALDAIRLDRAGAAAHRAVKVGSRLRHDTAFRAID